MRRIFLALSLMLFALPASAQIRDQNWTNCTTSSDPDTSIAGCTALIQFGQETVPADIALTYEDRAFDYGQKGLWDQAIADFTKVIALQPNNADAYYDLCVGYGSKDLWDQSIYDCSQAITIKPDYVSAYNNRALAYNQKGLYDLAIADENHAISLNPQDHIFNIYYNRANAYAAKGLRDQAIADYQTTLRLAPAGSGEFQGAQAGLKRLGVAP